MQTMIELIAARPITQSNLLEVLNELGYDSVQHFEDDTFVSTQEIMGSLVMYDEDSNLRDDTLYKEVFDSTPPTSEAAVLRVAGRNMGGGRYVTSVYLSREDVWAMNNYNYVMFDC